MHFRDFQCWHLQAGLPTSTKVELVLSSKSTNENDVLFFLEFPQQCIIWRSILKDVLFQWSKGSGGQLVYLKYVKLKNLPPFNNNSASEALFTKLLFLQTVKINKKDCDEKEFQCQTVNFTFLMMFLK